jgi:hypothetical protein
VKPTYEIGGSGSVVERARAHGLKLDQLPTSLSANLIVLGQHHPVDLGPDFGLDRPLVWVRPDVAELVIDGAIMGDLTPVDATGLSERPMELCAFMPGVWARIDHRAFVEFLLRTELITTYWHIGSTLELVAESRTEDEYTAHLVGEHEYYTNEHNVGPLDFTVICSPLGVRLREGGAS